MSNFYVGQKVVCIRDHSQGYVKAGHAYTIGAQRNCLRCGIHQVDVGVRREGMFLCVCNRLEPSSPIAWINAELFRPLDSLTEQIERIEQEGAPVELEPEYA